ncbi:hypothetical protein HK405_001844, partial [Cladochytrium tenue]
ALLVAHPPRPPRRRVSTAPPPTSAAHPLLPANTSIVAAPAAAAAATAAPPYKLDSSAATAAVATDPPAPHVDKQVQRVTSSAATSAATHWLMPRTATTTAATAALLRPPKAPPTSAGAATTKHENQYAYSLGGLTGGLLLASGLGRATAVMPAGWNPASPAPSSGSTSPSSGRSTSSSSDGNLLPSFAATASTMARYDDDRLQQHAHARVYSVARRVVTGPPSRNHWKPDGLAPACDLCGCQFGLITRRHHCRVCGGVVCGPCSPFFVRLDEDASPHPAGVLSRCCSACVDALTHPPRASSSSSDSVLPPLPHEGGPCASPD